MVRKKRDQENTVRVIIPGDHPNPPLPHEVEAALVLSRHFRSEVEFIVPVDDYKRKSADIVMLGLEWEIKSPTGKSKYTIQEQFRRASKQARNIIIDSRRTKLKYETIEKSVLLEMGKRPHIKNVVLIDKHKKVVAINT